MWDIKQVQKEAKALTDSNDSAKEQVEEKGSAVNQSAQNVNTQARRAITANQNVNELQAKLAQARNAYEIELQRAASEGRSPAPNPMIETYARQLNDAQAELKSANTALKEANIKHSQAKSELASASQAHMVTDRKLRAYVPSVDKKRVENTKAMELSMQAENSVKGSYLLKVLKSLRETQTSLDDIRSSIEKSVGEKIAMSEFDSDSAGDPQKVKSFSGSDFVHRPREHGTISPDGSASDGYSDTENSMYYSKEAAGAVSLNTQASAGNDPQARVIEKPEDLFFDSTAPTEDKPKVLINKNHQVDPYDLLERMANTIAQQKEVLTDHYREKGYTEDQIKYLLVVHEEESRREFLQSAFPQKNVSLKIFDYIPRGSEPVSDNLTQSFYRENIEYQSLNPQEKIKYIENRCKEIGLVKTIDLTKCSFRTAEDLAHAIEDGKRDFPRLMIPYVGTMDEHIDLIESKATQNYKRAQKRLHENSPEREKLDMDYNRVVDFCNDLRHESINGCIGLSLDPEIAQNKDVDCNFNHRFAGISVHSYLASDYDEFCIQKNAEVKQKFKPQKCNTPKATGDHEVGHRIAKMLDAEKDPVMTTLFEKMSHDNNAADSLSIYSQKNIGEFIAEGYCEYRNNDYPRAYSRCIFNRLMELYKGYDEGIKGFDLGGLV